MESEKVKVIKEYLRCMRGEKACWDCGLNEIAENQDTCCINLVADMALDLINELESENELLRNAKVVYENVDYCAEDLKKAQDRIAELEEGNKEQLKQFAEWLVARSNNVVYEKLVLEYINERIKG